ncbi:PilZ domain-containing protein [Zooshikella sp. RANM57]|uniref:PilZ domain-containing protein n=1 Tax=Zooshikella sp. RANM57 TaxID=3425863 RepID=UPI003D6EAAFD
MRENKRHSPRVERIERALIQLSSGCTRRGESGVTVSAQIRDVSVTGFKALLPAQIQEGAIVDVCISVVDHMHRYLLVAQVMWVKPDEEDTEYCLAGFRLLPSEESDLMMWMRAFRGISHSGKHSVERKRKALFGH